MKQTLRTYIYTCLIFLIPFILISLILSLLSYFMQINHLFIQIILQVFAYMTLILAALYLTSHLPDHRMKHCLFFSLLYFLISLCLHLDDIQYVHLIFKSCIFLLIGFFKEIKTRTIA